jgi:putative proteasome-type protease
MLHSTWGQKLREVFDSLDDPVWDDAHTATPLRVQSEGSRPLRKITRPEDKLI